jgi:solute carrier family 13 (sodium-dependent dicarboxylate transporter), member 2/3/5
MSPSASSVEARPAAPNAPSLRQRLGLLFGPLLFGIMLLLPSPAGMQLDAWRTAAVGTLIAIWWVTEAIPIPATALLPLALFPLLGIGSLEDVAGPYANPLIFLFMGGFMLALAVQRWGLHRRVALLIIRQIGTAPGRLVAGFMIATAVLSAWVSNTATVMMMLPIGISIVELLERREAPADGSGARLGGSPWRTNFGTCLMLGIAYAASVGGLATLVGTPPNALFAGFMLETYGAEIGFGEWMLVGVPLVLLSLPLVWLTLTRLTYPLGEGAATGGEEVIDRELLRLGRFSRPELLVAIIFSLTALAWIFRPLLQRGLGLPGLSDPGIAILAALALFVIPVNVSRGEFLLDWESAKKLPWGVLVLFGGGLSLAAAIQRSGLAEWIALSLAWLADWPTVLLLLGVTATIVFLTELTSNTATAAAFLPVLGALALGIGENPLLLVVPAALAASCAFMMPVATPPNAIVYGSGLVTVQQLARAGLLLNLLFIGIITLLAYTLLGLVFGVEPGIVPAWARPPA